MKRRDGDGFRCGTKFYILQFGGFVYFSGSVCINEIHESQQNVANKFLVGARTGLKCFLAGKWFHEMK